MANKKSAVDLKAHLACFDPVYPLRKGYIARLIGETRDIKTTALICKVKALVPTTCIEQDKCVDEIKLSWALKVLQKELKLKKYNLSTHWDSLVHLFQQQFPIHFKDVSNTVVLLQPQEISSSIEVSSVSTATIGTPSPTINKKCFADLKAHLARFEPVYPLKKGYIVQLFVETRDPSITALIWKIKTLIPTTSAEQDKRVDEIKLYNDLHAVKKNLKLKKNNLSSNWDSLVLLCQQPFPLYFKDAANTVILLQPQEIASSTDVSTVSSAMVGPPSPKKLRYDCHNCVTKQRTLNNLRETIVTLRRRLFDQRKHHVYELTKCKSIWKAKYESTFVRNNRFTKSYRKMHQLSTKNGYVDRNFITQEVETTQLDQTARNIDSVSDLPLWIKQEHDYESAEEMDPTEALKQELDEETANNVDVLDLTSHIKQELDLEATETCSHNQTELVEEDPDYDIEMKVDVSDQTFMSIAALTPTEIDSFTDTAISPTSSVFKSDSTIEDSPNKSIWDTLTEEEEALLTHFVKKKLKTGRHNIIVCKSNGLPIVLQKMTVKHDFRW